MRSLFLAVLGTAILAIPALAQNPAGAKRSEEGIPVTNKLVIQKCGACHF